VICDSLVDTVAFAFVASAVASDEVTGVPECAPTMPQMKSATAAIRHWSRHVVATRFSRNRNETSVLA